MIAIILVYNLLAYLTFPLLFPFFYFRRLLKGKPMPPFRKRLAWDLPPAPPSGRPAIWIHAVSVGEVQVVAPLVMEIEERHPQFLIYLSTTTATGQATAAKTFGGRVFLFYCPFDLLGAVDRTLRRIRPRHLIIAETEIWPNLLWLSKQHRLSVSIINGRISDQAYPRYRAVRPFMAPILKLPDQYLVQSEEDAKRFRALGAPEQRVHVIGNMKFDSIRQIRPDDSLADALRGLFGPGPVSLLLCGSTMDGEEEILARIFRLLQPDFPELRLLVAPRHPERFTKAAEAFHGEHFQVYLRSSWPGSPPEIPPDVIILDTMGELSSLYHMADAVFIGGTLVPTGGHNILEPAAAGKPIVVGPSMENFRTILAQFQQEDAIVQVPDSAGLAAALAELLRDRTLAREMGERAQATITRRRGATRRTINRIIENGATEMP
ncbi:MAG: glycosyltransferase [Acidobacteria bacterium]|nr:glycosyltransferase [Acidobacteriota bacterium]